MAGLKAVTLGITIVTLSHVVKSP